MLENRDVAAMGRDAAMWEKVVTKLHAGAMPPPASRRPDAATYQAFITAVEHALDQAAARAPNPGRPPIHRLNRLEYTNAIRDLFTEHAVGTDIWIALAECVGILVVAYLFAMATYRRRIS